MSVESNEFALIQVAFNVYFIILICISSILNALVVVSSPVERNISKWHKLSKHVKSCVGALIHGSYVMLNALLLASLPVGVGGDITSSIDVLDTALKVRVANDGTPLVKGDA